ncbi:MAG: hypothetical protein ACI9Y1_000469 [Lentisphaeria bacterium]|jgi:hypothetical protein
MSNGNKQMHNLSFVEIVLIAVVTVELVIAMGVIWNGFNSVF